MGFNLKNDDLGSFLSDANLSQAAIVSLGEIARNGSLIFENRSDLLSVIECLQKKLLTSQETTKLKEKVAATLGYMCLHPVVFISQGEKDESELNLNKLVMQKLLDSSQAKQIELHMAIGEALVNCALADRSDALINPWLTEYESANRKDYYYLSINLILFSRLYFLHCRSGHRITRKN